MKPYIIGIAGGSGSGKSTFAQRLKEAFPDHISLISCDNYYLPHDELPLEERAHLNYDAPEALEFDLMVHHLEELKNGKTALCPVYDFSQHTRSSRVTEIKPRPIILIDGILIFHDPALRDCMDLKIYVETDADERILRRAKRDMQERGRDLDSVIDQYLTTVKPMHNTYVKPTRVFADIILNGGKNEQAFILVKTQIERILKKHKEI
ncbi:MAG: uridine kinase [Ruminococcaceae bacterium]|nr:uridine kinase [Oscillospiraceae bacterium]